MALVKLHTPDYGEVYHETDLIQWITLNIDMGSLFITHQNQGTIEGTISGHTVTGDELDKVLSYFIEYTDPDRKGMDANFRRFVNHKFYHKISYATDSHGNKTATLTNLLDSKQNLTIKNPEGVQKIIDIINSQNTSNTKDAEIRFEMIETDIEHLENRVQHLYDVGGH